MADNTQLNPMTGGDVIAAADMTSLNGAPVSGVKVERVKIGHGEGGEHFDVHGEDPLPVRIDDVIELLIQILGRLGASDGLGRMLVAATATQSGTWTVQPGNTANTTAWLVTNQVSSTSLYGPAGAALDQHYQSIQAYDAIRSKITVT